MHECVTREIIARVSSLLVIAGPVNVWRSELQTPHGLTRSYDSAGITPQVSYSTRQELDFVSVDTVSPCLPGSVHRPGHHRPGQAESVRIAYPLMFSDRSGLWVLTR